MGRRLDVTGSLSAYFSTYYASAIGKTGSALHAEMHRIIPSGVTTLTYDQVWTTLEDTDQDPDNASNVIEVYSGRSVAKSDNGGGVDQWNREHVRAKSHGGFGTVNGPGTDVHHLPGHLRHLAAQPEPVHRPPRVGHRDLRVLTGEGRWATAVVTTSGR